MDTILPICPFYSPLSCDEQTACCRCASSGGQRGTWGASGDRDDDSVILIVLLRLDLCQ